MARAKGYNLRIRLQVVSEEKRMQLNSMELYQRRQDVLAHMVLEMDWVKTRLEQKSETVCELRVGFLIDDLKHSLK